MPFFKPRAPPQNDVDVILESIASGQFDDDTINELRQLVDISDDDEVDRVAESLLSNIVKTDDRNVLIGTVKALTALPFMPEGKDESVIRIMVTLFSEPQNTRMTLQHKMLQNEILRFLLSILKTDVRYAQLMMTELIASLEYAYITNDADAYPALEVLAANKPEYFRPHTETLVKSLGSINKKTRAQSAKLIGIIGGKYPEYVSSAMPVLQSLASFYPDAQVKHNASEAYQILYHGLRLDVAEPVVVKDDDRHKQRSSGFADILKKKATELLSKPSHESGRAGRGSTRDRASRVRPIAQGASDQPDEELKLADMEGFETEIKQILDKTRDDFASDAEGILDSIGVGHLSVKGKDKPPISALMDTAPAVDGGVAVHTPKRPIHARSPNINVEARTKSATMREAMHKDAHAETHKDAHAETHKDAHAETHKAHVEAAQPDINPHEGSHKPTAHHVVQSPPDQTGLNVNVNSSKATESSTIGGLETEKPVEKKPEAPEAPAHPASVPPAHHSKHLPPVEKPVAQEPVKPVHQHTVKPKSQGDGAAKRIEKAIAWGNRAFNPLPSDILQQEEKPEAQIAAPKAQHIKHTSPESPRQPEAHPTKSEARPEPVSAPSQPMVNVVPEQKVIEPTPVIIEKTQEVNPVVEAKPTAPLPEPEVIKPLAEIAPPMQEERIEAPAIPPKVMPKPAVPQSPIAPAGGRKITVSKMGITDKPLEGHVSPEESKKDAVVPGSSISGFGQNRNIYKCPKCGARTLVEGELCKICKMTMERPQQMVRCERCGLMNNRYARFCRKCGAKLDKDKSPMS